jgi:Zn-dependent M28 family amino/carboxypeptidase
VARAGADVADDFAMMNRWLLIVVFSACSSSPMAPGGDDDMPPDAPAPTDVPKAIFDAVARANIEARLNELTGVVPVTAGGSTFSMTNRWAVAAKQNFRAYWTDYMTALGAQVNELTFPIPNLVGETQGHNVEAILPGRSADSIVIIVHYDTVGITGKETKNPGADDDGSGLATQLEAARIFASYPDRAKTVRFVAADYEEISDNLDGDYAYVDYLKAEAASKGFTIIAASDNDQTGWSCWSENLCSANSPPKNTTFQVIACSGDSHHYDYPDLSKGMTDVAAAYSTTIVPRAVCDGSGDTDHYPFWVANIPAYVIEEWGSENNPHYDDTGNDTMAHIDLDLLTEVSKIQITFQAKLAGIGER